MLASGGSQDPLAASALLAENRDCVSLLDLNMRQSSSMMQTCPPSSSTPGNSTAHARVCRSDVNRCIATVHVAGISFWAFSRERRHVARCICSVEYDANWDIAVSMI